MLKQVYVVVVVLVVGEGGSYSWYHAFATQEREIYRGGETEENCLRKKMCWSLKTSSVVKRGFADKNTKFLYVRMGF